MRFDDMRLRNKLLLPVAMSGLIILGLVIFASLRLNALSIEAEELITRRDLGTILTARAARRLTQVQAYDYVVLTNDSDTDIGKRASSDFEAATKDTIALFDEAARLLPTEAATIGAFKDRFLAIEPKLFEAFKIGKATPGLEHAEGLKQKELEAIAKASAMLSDAVSQTDRIIADTVNFNSRMLRENADRAAELKRRSAEAYWLLWASGIGAAILSIGFALWLSTTKVVRPLLGVTDEMRRLAAGDTGIEIAGRGRRDEVGAMAQAVQVFKDNALQKIRLEEQAAAARRDADADKARHDALRAEQNRMQAHVVETIANGLDHLAQGKLTFRITEVFPPDYERLRTDFNGAMERLQATVSVVANNTMALRSGTKDISSASDDLARRTEQQAANLEETAAALQQITETVHKTSAGAAHAHRLIAQARDEAEASGRVVRDAVSAMNSIEKSSSQMSQIIAVIDEIAFQTNLLALNAGVEAARAGEAGRGFAVVASEVRGLAQRSAEAAKEIKTLITASTQQVEQGVDLVGKTGAALQVIVRSVGEITDIVAEIAEGAKEQSSGLTEINTAVAQMDKNTQQNAAMVEESTAASHGLARETDELAKVIEGFDLGAGKAARAATFVPASRQSPEPARVAAPRKVVNARGSQPAGETEDWREF